MRASCCGSTSRQARSGRSPGLRLCASISAALVLGRRSSTRKSGPRSTGTIRTTGSSWPRDRWRGCRSGARAGSPWSRGARRPTARPRRRPTASSAPRSSLGLAIVIQGQVALLPLHQRRRRGSATHLKGKTPGSAGAPGRARALGAPAPSARSAPPALVRFSVQGDYGRVAPGSCGLSWASSRPCASCAAPRRPPARGANQAADISRTTSRRIRRPRRSTAGERFPESPTYTSWACCRSRTTRRT